MNKLFSHTGNLDGLNEKSQVILFIHGAGMDHTVWASQKRYFAYKGYTTLSIDLPGHGDNINSVLHRIEDMSDYVYKILTELRIQNIKIVGHSMGSLIALDIASRYSKMVDRVVLLGACSEMKVHPKLLDAAKNDLSTAIEMIVNWGLCSNSKIGGADTPGMWVPNYLRVLIDRVTTNILGSDFTACDNFKNGIKAAKSVVCPTLIIAGKQDIKTPLNKGKELSSLIKNSTFTSIDDCGHMMMLEEPFKVNKAINKIIVA